MTLSVVRPDQSPCAAPAMGTSAVSARTRTLTTLASHWSSLTHPGPSLVSDHTLCPSLCVVVTLMLRDQPITIHMGTGMEMWPGQPPIGQMITTQASDWSEQVSRGAHSDQMDGGWLLSRAPSVHSNYSCHLRIADRGPAACYLVKHAQLHS